MFELFGLWFGALLRAFRTHHSLMLENLALRQQLAVLKRKHPKPTLGAVDKLFWVLARHFSAAMEGDAHYRPARNGRSMASGRIQTVLDHAVQSPQTSGRWPEDLERDPRTDLPDGRGESNLGRTAHPRRTSHVGLRGIGDDRHPLDEASTQASRTRQTLAGVPA